MKKGIAFLIILLIMVTTIPAVTSKPIDIVTDKEPTSILGVTFVAGYIVDPTENRFGRVSANAVALFYIDRGVIIKDSGIVTGLKTISFKNNPYIFMYEQDSLGLTRIFGICSGFRIGF